MIKNRILGFFILGFLMTNVTLVSSTAFAEPVESTFQLASILQSNMVIQQGKDFKLWGKSKPGSQVSVFVSWSDGSSESESDLNGDWQISLPVPKVGIGDFKLQTLTISHEEGEVVLENILIGEVWVCSGQSNMDMEMKAIPPWLEGVVDYENEIAAAEYPNIRFIKIEKNFTKDPLNETKGTWNQVSPTTAGDLSGVAYYFARNLQEKLKIPVGLVISSYGGSAIQAWMSKEALAEDEVLNINYLEPYDQSPESEESLEGIETLEQLFEILTRPSLLYNAMIHPLKKLSIRGFLWYQGESNKNEAQYYTRLNKVLIENWRKDFDQGNLPFYFVQMTPYNWEESDPDADYYAKFRESQEKVLKVTPNVGMAVTMDIGEVNNIHPRNKKDVGLRLSRIALNLTYGKNETQYLGPKFDSFLIVKNRIEVTFEPQSVGSGLSTNDGEPPKHFFIAGDDEVFYPALAEISGDKVILWSEKVKNPSMVRYAFTNYPITNFQNREGLPATPFRTDDKEN
ncbi:sialate O-acetylesterase [Pararhodonellum marinum]|uniref:sialate O-acetylesterase n=1 Tax=Pararhodonellum marinum TaxID=2755358 RepID=UPI00188F82EB|nr:sialate O-acetylesterase [Pararhodonellum marinum]